MSKPTVDSTKLTERLIDVRKQYADRLRAFTYFEHGGMALANHRVETLEALTSVKACAAEVNDLERMLGLKPSSLVIPKSRYEDPNYRTREELAAIEQRKEEAERASKPWWKLW